MKFIRWQLPFIIWTLTIVVLTWYPRIEFPDLGIEAEDKIAHIVAFCFWGLLLFRARTKYEIKHLSIAVKLVIFTGICFAVIDESVQSLVPGRYFSLYDMLANVIGVCLSWPVFRYIVVQFAQRYFQQQD